MIEGTKRLEDLREAASIRRAEELKSGKGQDGKKGGKPKEEK